LRGGDLAMARRCNFADSREQSARVRPSAEKTGGNVHLGAAREDGRPAAAGLGDPARQATAVASDRLNRAAGYRGSSVVWRQW
jgi:hypothetical protein